MLYKNLTMSLGFENDFDIKEEMENISISEHLSIQTNDGCVVSLSKEITRHISKKSAFFESMSNGKWKPENNISIPFSLYEFCVFQNYIVGGEIPKTKIYHRFQRLCEYFCIHENMMSKDTNDLFVLSEKDKKIRDDEIDLRKKIIEGFVPDDKQNIITYIPKQKIVFDDYHTLNHTFNAVKFEDGIYGISCVEEESRHTDERHNSIHSSFYCNLFNKLKQQYPTIPLVMAGGAVLSMYNNLYTKKKQDIDLFFVTKNEDQVLKSIDQLYKFMIFHYGARTIFVRSNNAITIHAIVDRKYYNEFRVAHNRLGKPNYCTGKTFMITIQFILRLYGSITEVISGFDIDPCCVAFDGTQYYGTQRFLRSQSTCTILVDPERQSLNYSHRLMKYSTKGYLLKIPGFFPKQINMELIQSKTPVHGLAKVVRHFLKSYNYHRDNMELSDYDDKIHTLIKESLYFCEYKNINIFGHILETLTRRLSNKNKPHNPIPMIMGDKLENIMSSGKQALRFTREFIQENTTDDDKMRFLWGTIAVGNNTFPPIHHNINEFKLMTINPSTQLTDSFHPTQEDWYLDLY